MDTYEGAFEFWQIEDAKEIGECASCGCTIYDDDEYDESIRGCILCADCALAQQIMAAESEAEREKE